MIIDGKLLSELEELSKIRLPDECRENILNDLNKILEYAEQLNVSDVDGDGLISCAGTDGLREDEALENDFASHADDGYRVPKTFE